MFDATSPFDSAQGPVTFDLATTNTDAHNERQSSTLSGVERHGKLGTIQ